MPTFTAFCQETTGQGTIWIEAVEAADLEAAKDQAIIQCAEAWEFDPEGIHLLGLATGQVDILHWEDLNDD